MPRSPDQIRRLLLESEILSREMPQFKLYELFGSNTRAEGWASTSAGSDRYKLRACIPGAYPDEEPDLYVIQPKTLCKHGGKEALNTMCSTHAFHNYESENGYVQVCHTLFWDASMTLVRVFTKGLLWLEAYEGHLRTGKNIAQILDEWSGSTMSPAVEEEDETERFMQVFATPDPLGLLTDTDV